ncbi:galactokinase family protein, partial [Weissella soli]
MDNQIFTELEGTFADKFGHQPAHHFFSPGRVNLIGEHTDYNGGHVFPAAITIGTFGVASSREDNLVKVYSLNFPDQGVVTFDINDEEKLAGNAWPNFIKGLLIELRAEGYSFDHGFELAV